MAQNSDRDPEYAARRIVNAVTNVPSLDDLPGSAAEIFSHWQSLSQANQLPDQAAFKLDELPPKMIPWSIVYDVKADGIDFSYRFFGTQRSFAHGRDYTGETVSAMTPVEIRDKILKELRNIVRNKTPTLIKTDAALYGVAFQYSMLRLPLSSDGSNVTRIYAVTFDGTGPELDNFVMRRWYNT